MTTVIPSPSPCDPSSAAAPVPSAVAGQAEFEKEQDSLRRAMPIQRLIGGGMRYDDAMALHAMSVVGVAWQDAGRWLGDRNMRIADDAGSVRSARAWYRYASACYRFGQSAMPRDSDEKRALHTLMVDAFAQSAALDEPATEKLEINWGGGKLCGWLMRPPAVANPPVVIIMGGFDGWREEYEQGAARLVERGVAAALFDGPGQGETRLQHGIYLDDNFHRAFSAMADHLLVDPRLGSKIGIWGNSLGGFLAARTVVADPRFAALCVNGGTVRPIELPERFPRFWEKVEALTGAGDCKSARLIMETLDLAGMLGAITCPLIQLHGTPDTVFLLENARRIHDGAASSDKTLLIWEDGDHCIYNHSEEKNIVVADLFASRLASA